MANEVEQGAGQAHQQHAGHDQVHAQQLLGADHLAADAAVGGHEIFSANRPKPGVDQAQSQACENARRSTRYDHSAQPLQKAQAQYLSGFVEL
ncbi:hypothetical protein D3C77_685620 [compost metagenome]